MHSTIHSSLQRSRTLGTPFYFVLMLATFSLFGTVAQAASPRVVIVPEPGFSITWDGNNGGFSSPEPGAGPSNNVALASGGTVAFGSSEFGGGGVHLIANVNDGLYGNSHSWISDFTIPDPGPFIGLSFASSVDVSSIAWGRDNGDSVGDACGGTCMDRNVGIYTLQFTQVPSPDALTPETDDASTGWASLGTIQYLPGADDTSFVGYLRHRFDVAEGANPVAATGLRIKVSDSNIAIDEIEVNPIADLIPPLDLVFEVESAEGFSIVWDGNEGNYSDPGSPALAPDNAARSGTAFGSSEFGSGHLIANVIDGQYGNLASWIANFVAPDPNPFIGINFGECIPVRTLAWSRDNGDAVDNCCGGTATDRTLGVYTLQFTARTDADATTPETGDALSGWQTIGTIEYKANDPLVFISHLRHRFDLSAAGGPVLAAAIRIKVPNAGIAIDEIEVNVNQVDEQQLLSITAQPGFEIGWDGNQGDFHDPMIGAEAPSNQAMASAGTVAFASSEASAFGHLTIELNDGLYGNLYSWISDFTLPDMDPFAGLNFGLSIAITNIAWSRDNGDNIDNCCGGVLTDRANGTYTMQITEVPDPDGTTLETDDAATGWQTIGTIAYALSAPPDWLAHLRHRFEVSSFGGPIFATGLRIKVPNNGIAIDEIEVNTGVEAPPTPDPVLPIVIAPGIGFEIGYDGNDGDFENAVAGAAPPSNRGLASEGTTAFASSELADFGHFTAELNDGLYGNASSWISGPGLGTDPNPFVGLDFGGTISITNIAWSRDNGDGVEGASFTDRSVDTYTLQFTQVPGPDATTAQTDDESTGWATIGTVGIQGTLEPLFHSWLRHRFEVAQGGIPLEATGLRIRLANNATAIDEIEVNTAGPVTPEVVIVRMEDSIVVTWAGEAVLEAATSIDGPWLSCVLTGPRRYSAPVRSGEERYFRLRL